MPMAKLLLALLAGAACAGAFSSPEFGTTNLRCEGGPSFGEDAAAFGVGTEQPKFTWTNLHTERSQSQTAYELVLREHRAHASSFDEMPLVWSSGRVEGAAPRCTYPASAPPLRSATTYAWKVRYWDSKSRPSAYSAAAGKVHVALLSQSEWDGVAWLGSNSTSLYRSSFKLDGAKQVSSATAYVLGLGYSYVRLNGHAVGGLLTTAPWSNNMRRNSYSAIDVTPHIAAGGVENVLGVGLGHGWRDFRRKDNDGCDATERVLRAQLRVTYADGTQAVATHTGDGGWATAAGPSVADSVYDGETYDARLEQPGWDAAGFDASAWAAATALPSCYPQGPMTAWSAPPVLLDRVLAPKAVTQPRPGVFVVDFGENVAGVCKLSNIELAAGANVTLRHAEILQHKLLPDLKSPDPAMIYRGNLRTAKATDVYIAKGAGAETFTPAFTYHGFRYVEVTGLAALHADDIRMHHFHSAVARKANATFGSDVLNGIQALAVGAQRSNLMTIATDCDQRDERLGWMGDVALSVDSICLNFDCAAFASGIAQAMDDEMDADGSLPDVVPWSRYGGRPADVSWSAAFVQTASTLHREAADLRVASRYYPDFVRQLDNVKTQAAEGLTRMRTPYGDWCPPPRVPGGGQGRKPSAPYTSAFSYVRMAKQLAELASALGNATEAERVRAEADELVAHFNAAFHSGNGTYDNDMQTDASLALALGAAKAAGVEPAVQARLAASVAEANNHHTTGIIGWRFLFDGLRAGGHEEVALALLEQTDYPSMGFMRSNEYEPATANLWELNDAYHEGTGMNSRNHHMWSSYSHYLVSEIGGMAHAADLALRLAPATTRGLSSATVSLALPHGVATHAWRRHGGAQCAKVAAGLTLALDCGAAGGVIEQVVFASFGQPSGVCGALRPAENGCHAPASEAALRALCVGRARCELDLAREVAAGKLALPASCPASARGGEAWFWAEARCSVPSQVHSHVELPVGMTAMLRLPHGLHGIDRPVVLERGQAQRRVERALDHAGRAVVDVALGSGTWDVVLKQAQ